MRTTPNLGLTVWDQPGDDFDSTELAANWDAIDADYNRARPANQVEILASLPVTNLFNGRLVYLNAAVSGFPANTVVRYDGSVWRSVGPHEILSTVPVTGNYAGRLVLLSAADSGFSAWTLIRYDGSAWAMVNRGVDVSATVPVTNNYAGRLVVLSASAGGFNAWDVIRYNGTVWHRIGPPANAAKVSSFPGSPTDGDIAYIGVTGGHTWQFRFDSGSASTYKWEFIGGSPLNQEIATTETAIDAGWDDMATSGPSLTTPLAGEYEVIFSAQGRVTGQTGQTVGVAPKFGAAATLEADSAWATQQPIENDNNWVTLTRSIVRTITSASTVVKLQYWAVPSIGINEYRYRNLLIRPVRCI